MKYRKLRIAWSVVWGGLAVLLIVLWVRSYWWNDGISGTNGIAFTRILTVQGNIYLQRLAPNRGGPIPWKSFHKPIARNTSVPDARFLVLADGWEVAIPFWLTTVSIVVLSAAPWLHFRFTLRTLLIATTLVAIVLGLVVRELLGAAQ